MAAGRSALTKMANQKKTAKIHKQEIIEGLSLRDYVIPRSNKPNRELLVVLANVLRKLLQCIIFTHGYFQPPTVCKKCLTY